MSLRYKAVLAYIHHVRARAFRSKRDFAKHFHADERARKEPPASVSARLDTGRIARPGYELWWLAPRFGAARSNVHVLYLHGGSFVFGITPSHWNFLAQMVESTGCTVHVALYPRAPQHTYKETQAAVLDAEWYAGAQARDGSLVLMGDSAGASLALWLAANAAQRGVRRPTTILISPCADLALDNPEIAAIEERDPWLTQAGLQYAIRLWLRDTAPSAGCVNPMAQDFSGLAPMHIFIGDRDILLPDCLALARRLEASGTPTHLHVGLGMCHVWPLLPVPEAREAVSLIHSLVQQHEGSAHALQGSLVLSHVS